MTPPTTKPRIAIGADHAGFKLKELVKQHLAAQGYEIDDVGAQSEESTDYPDYARAVAERVAAGQDQRGVLVCGTGIGMVMTANKVPGVRAGLAHDINTAHLAREHNDANVITLGARVVDEKTALDIVREFLTTEFAGGRHKRRVDKINELDTARAKPRAK
ncbi:MAG TPA: ribose 5-phosphate isomerase B [Candidatus Acidoferrales bacterium]